MKREILGFDSAHLGFTTALVLGMLFDVKHPPMTVTTGNQSLATSWEDRAWFLGVLATFFFLRLYQIGAQALTYFDEGGYVLEGALLAHKEPSAPQFYARPGFVLLLGLARSVWNSPIQSARAISILASLFSLLVLWKWLPRQFSKQVRNYSCLIFSLLPLQVYYSRIVFPDALASCVLLLAVIFFVEAVRIRVDGVSSNAWWLLGSAFFFGYFFTVGSYRAVPLLLVILPLVFFFLFRRPRWRGELPLLFVGLILAALPTVLFQKKYNFVSQMLGLAFGQPNIRAGGEAALRFDFLYFPYVFFYYFAPLAVLFVALFLARCVPPHERRQILDNTHLEPTLMLGAAVIFVPVVFHSIFSIKALKVWATAFPWIALCGGIAISQIRSRQLKNIYVLATFAVLFTQSFELATHLGWEGLQKYADTLATLEGDISDGAGGPTVLASARGLDTKRTRVHSPWACASNPVACNADYMVVKVEDFASFSSEERKKYRPFLYLDPLRLPPSSSRLMSLECLGSTPIKKVIQDGIGRPLIDRFVVLRKDSGYRPPIGQITPTIKGR